ncbi:adenylate kinase [Actinokineospora sp. G85]|uniref:adenylate kinase n=1 Tax=Actinokineospora sp. G85 TaxID=3406626 RepID=UPI003C783996
MTRVVLVGPPGAGKGTQAKALSAELGVPHISTGDLFRAHIANNTELGLQVKAIIDSGGLVPDEVTNEMVRVRLAEADAQGGFLLDGFPRNTGQADFLRAVLGADELNAVVEFKIDEDVVVGRMLGRGRADDNEGVIRHRLEVYRKETAPLLDYYAALLISIDAVGEVGEVTQRVLSALRGRA